MWRSRTRCGGGISPTATHPPPQTKLAEFMASGQGWLDKTSGKGAVDAALAEKCSRVFETPAREEMDVWIVNMRET